VKIYVINRYYSHRSLSTTTTTITQRIMSSSSSSSSTDLLSKSIESLDINDQDDLFIDLISVDNKVFRILKKNAVISDMISVALEDKDATEISINVKYDTLEYIVEYMNKKSGDKSVVVSSPLKATMEDSCTPSGKWEAEFINKVYVDGSKIHAVVMAANYLAINSLLHIASARIALGLKGKSKEKMIEELKMKTKN